MTNHVILNNVEHRDLRVRKAFGAEYGDDQMCTLAIPSEFRNLQADYPIFFHRDEEAGQYLPMAMFGFQQYENLFLDGDQWTAHYVPLMLRRGPFLIGRQQRSGETGENLVISIDVDDPRVGDEGESLFTSFGDNSEYLESIIEVMQAVDQGQGDIAQFTGALLEHDLIEPFTLDVTLNNGKQHRLEGFHTIHEENLTQLNGEVLADFSRRGILQAAYMMVASMANIPDLIMRKNRLG